MKIFKTLCFLFITWYYSVTFAENTIKIDSVPSSSNDAVNQQNVIFSNFSLKQLRQGSSLIQMGIFSSDLGKAQKINIDAVIGDYYSKNDINNFNFLFGAGYFVPFKNLAKFDLSYGLNIFYLFNSQVEGDIIQERSFDNFHYQFKVNHLPIYAVLKTALKHDDLNTSITSDIGIGPNLFDINQFRMHPLNNFSVADNSFTGQSKIKFSLMAGIGLKINNLVQQKSLECNFRFFYLGKGNLKVIKSGVLNKLSTGQNYAEAIMCGVYF